MHCNCKVGVNISNIIINITRWLAREKDQTQNYILQFPHHPQPTQTKHVPSFHIHIPFAIFHTTKEKTWWDCGRTGGLNVRLKFIFFFFFLSPHQWITNSSTVSKLLRMLKELPARQFSPSSVAHSPLRSRVAPISASVSLLLTLLLLLPP